MLLRDLAWLVTLADRGHVTDTAAILGTNQPTLSRVLGRAEAELDARLFIRTPSGVRPTPAGQLVIDAARQITRRWDQTRVELQTLLDPHSGVVRLAFLDSIATSLVPRLLRRFHEHEPQVRLVLRQAGVAEIVADLNQGEAELAITSAHPEGPFHWRTLEEERLVLAVSPNHRLSGQTRVSLGELTGEGFVTIPRGSGYRDLTDQLLAAAGVVPSISFESTDLATIEGLVGAGLGVALLPEPLSGQSGTIGIELDTEDARRTIGVLWRSDRTLTPPARRFMSLLDTPPNAWPVPDDPHTSSSGVTST